jgi:uncharacterized protein with ParB-like and HNH nuclease domain
MSELIYSVRDIFQKYLQSEGCSFFNIPEYQRGYKWSDENVTQLLIDLKNFQKLSDSSAFYCLQNITITKSSLDGEKCFNVIDGQQRLTTLFIIVSYIQRYIPEKDKVVKNGFEILKYSVRKSTDMFLRQEILSGSLWDSEINPSRAETKDQYYIMVVAKAVSDWFETNSLDYRTILDNLKLIVNQVDSGDEETVFASLNGGKVELDGADLVRAILVTRAAKQKYPEIVSRDLLNQIAGEDINLNIDITVSSQGKINEFRIKLGIELDEINKWWSNPDVHNYFEQLLPNKISQNKSFRHSQYPIDLLYYAFYEAYKNKLVDTDKDRDLELRFFENGIDFNGDASDDHLEFYYAVKEFHMTMVEWFENEEIFNLVGYLMYNYKSSAVTFAVLWNKWEQLHSKKMFIDAVKTMICEQLASNFSGDDDEIDNKLISLRKAILDLSYDWYNNDFTTKFLPLLDILPSIKETKKGKKIFYNKVKVDYLKCIKGERGEDKEHVRSQTRRTNSDNLTMDEEQALIKENNDGINSIGNIVLLDNGVNRSYGNSGYTLKMDRIVNEFLMNDCYIRPHTYEVFISKLKNMDNNGIDDSELFWSNEDITRTVESIDSRISDYLNFPSMSELG